MKEGLKGVKDSLQQDVLLAEQHRNRGEHDEVHEIVHSRLNFDNRTLVTPGNITLPFSEIVRGVEVADDELSLYISIALGVLGLTRIWHDDTNRMIRDKQLQTIGDDREKIESIYEQVESVYHEFKSARNIPRTIDGSGIHWDLEINQSKGRSCELLGKRQEAINCYFDSVAAGNMSLENMSDPIERASTISAMAVNKLRAGILTHSQNLIHEALHEQLESNSIQLNTQRTKDLAKMVLKAGLNNWKQCLHPKYLTNIITSLQVLLTQS